MNVMDLVAQERLRRAQAVNRLHEAMNHLTADEIEQLVEAVRTGAWRVR